MVKYIAHKNQKKHEFQTIKEHSENTAILCKEFAIQELKELMYAIGLLHDIGKYQDSFQDRINGKSVQVEHSICGALVAKNLYRYDAVKLIMEYCIAGHHSGIPDGGVLSDTSDKNTLYGRLKRRTEDYQAYKQELEIPLINEQKIIDFISRDCGRDISMLIDKFAFIVRYCFSCLTDADSIDTANFCDEKSIKPLCVKFDACLEKIDKKLNSFVSVTPLQKARSDLQEQVFVRKNEDSEIYLMNMPTGSGKTLCSMKFALERAIINKKKRIIYIIPYNSIIDQTAEVFERLFCEDLEILRHQSTFLYDEKCYDEKYIDAVKYATENWDAPFIITTTVQFFDSVYSNKRGKLRKLHNMADSILIFDEAHLMPQSYLQPCLQAITYITRYLNSEAVFLTATMPDFIHLLKKYTFPDTKIMKLITDCSKFKLFQKCKYSYIGEISKERLLGSASRNPSSLIIVNKRKSARELYEDCVGEKYHLSTYMTSYDRKKVLKKIRTSLLKLEEDFPNYANVPEERRITIISTSLIEAGVDLDVYTVYRELIGLDSILQSGGRCNREGKREIADTVVFELMTDTKRISEDERKNITKGLFSKHEDISRAESIQEYYERLFFLNEEEIHKNTMSRKATDIRGIPFKTYSDEFELIDDTIQVSIIIPKDEYSSLLMEKVEYEGKSVIRKLQDYMCSVSRWEFEDLLRQHVLRIYDSGICSLINMDYYDENIGILFDAQDYIL